MKYLENKGHLGQELQEHLAHHKVIYEDCRPAQLFRLYDMRDKEFPQKFYALARTVFGVVLNEQSHVLLVDHPKRGWEICGGHLNDEEASSVDIISALHREVLEESGYTITRPELNFVVHVTNYEESTNKSLNCLYPRDTLMLYYLCQASKQISNDLEDGIKAASFFPILSASTMVSQRNKTILLTL